MTRAAVFPFLIAAGLATVTAVVGATITVLDEWYYSLAQPAWAPPDYAFGIIWTVIFALIALSGFIAWHRFASRKAMDTVLGMFALNGFLNLLWSFLFFRLQRPDWAFYELILLWLSILLLIVYCGRHSKLSAILLVPYLIWVTIAGVLNYQVIQLNGPFG